MTQDEQYRHDRNFGFNIFPDGPGEVVGEVQRGPEQIWVTPELKAAAQDFSNSWLRDHTEDLGEHGVDSVRLKFANVEVRDSFMALLNRFAMNCRRRLSGGVPMPVSESSGPYAMMRYELFKPDVFSEILTDLSKAEASTIPVSSETRTLVESYLAAFSIPFVWAELCMDEDGDQAWAEQMGRALNDSQKKLVVFLKRLSDSLPKSNEHRVTVRSPNEFEVDGQPMKFDGAALRALLTLILLREKQGFKVQEFAALYHGGKTDIARTDFDNGFNALKKKLSHLSRTASESNRSVSGVKFHVNIPDKAIAERLKSLYKK